MANADSCCPSNVIALIASWTVPKKCPYWVLHIFIWLAYQVVTSCHSTFVWGLHVPLLGIQVGTKILPGQDTPDNDLLQLASTLTRAPKTLISRISLRSSSFHLGIKSWKRMSLLLSQQKKKKKSRRWFTFVRIFHKPISRDHRAIIELGQKPLRTQVIREVAHLQQTTCRWGHCALVQEDSS